VVRVPPPVTVTTNNSRTRPTIDKTAAGSTWCTPNMPTLAATPIRGTTAVPISIVAAALYTIGFFWSTVAIRTGTADTF